MAFASDPQGVFDLYERPSTGGESKPLLKLARRKIPTDWSPDGRFLLYYEVNPERNRDVWALPTAIASKPMPLLQSPANEAYAVFSPDGKWFAYSSDESGKQEIYVQGFPPSPGRKWVVSNGGGSHPRWPGAGKTLFYLAPDGRVVSVDVSVDGAFTTGIPQPLFQAGMVQDFRSGFGVTADGQRFLIPTALSQTSSRFATVVVNWANEIRR